MFIRSNVPVSRLRWSAFVVAMVSAFFFSEVKAQQAPKLNIPDVVVRDQQGRKVHFYSDLVKDKVVVLNFFYTSCTYTCTMQGRTFSQLQSLLGDRMGKSVYLISVTTDPATDNPEQLRAWAKRYNLKSGWTLVTGDEAEINKLLVQLTGSSAGGGMHVPVTFVANDRKGTWISSIEVVSPEQLLKTVNYLTSSAGENNKALP
jgi:protein SCO1